MNVISTTRYTIKLTAAVVCAMQLDDKAMRKELGIEAGYKHLKRGAKITGSLDELSKLAHHMTREDGWDLSPSTVWACNHAAKKLAKFIAEKRAGKDLP